MVAIPAALMKMYPLVCSKASAGVPSRSTIGSIITSSSAVMTTLRMTKRESMVLMVSSISCSSPAPKKRPIMIVPPMERPMTMLFIMKMNWLPIETAERPAASVNWPTIIMSAAP